MSDDLLDIWSVHDPCEWENDVGPKGWFAVSNENGIVAYFGVEQDAYRFRLDQINRIRQGGNVNQYRIEPLAGGEPGEWKYFNMSAFQAECAKWARMGCEFKVYFRTVSE